jgi:hypothetical protein
MLQNAFLDWHKDHPYHLVKEPDPSNAGGHLVVAHQHSPLPLIFNVWAGMIINSLRSALDLLSAALAKRNGQNPSADTHFPIFGCEMDMMIDPLTGIEGKKWLSKRERATIKALKPYRGGDYTIWPLHKLDILRKHVRLLSARPDIKGFCFTSSDPQRAAITWGGGIGMYRTEEKAILCRLGPSESHFDPAQGHTTFTAFIAFDEAIGLLPFVDQQVSIVLMRFAERVAEIIDTFRPPAPFGDIRDLLPRNHPLIVGRATLPAKSQSMVFPKKKGS